MTETRTAAPAMIQARDRLIVALDVDSAVEARRVIAELRDMVGGFKVGLQLFTVAGPDFVRDLCESGSRVFLDLKFHDIPNTVAKAGVEATRLGVWMFNVHASGGNEMMRQTVSEVGEFCATTSNAPPLIIGVTVLTSSSDDALDEIGIKATAAEQVLRLAKLSEAAGVGGVVASPVEAAMIRRECGSNFKIVTPGIRPFNATTDDQKRVTTPAEAVRNGSDYLVVGRPVIAAADRTAAVSDILLEISSANNDQIS